jgi:DNA-binding NarL/FixJ family response regulator
MPTIVVVDDHPTFRATACALLQAEGFEVIGEAEDGLTALEVIERLAPEVVLLDVQLPDIDGFEVAERVARFSPAPQIVLASSREARDYDSLITESCVCGFIEKSDLSGEAIAALLA